jgi:hypothetical protein
LYEYNSNAPVHSWYGNEEFNMEVQDGKGNRFTAIVELRGNRFYRNYTIPNITDTLLRGGVVKFFISGKKTATTYRFDVDVDSSFPDAYYALSGESAAE